MKKTKNLVFLVTVLVLLNSGPTVMASDDDIQERTEMRVTSALTPKPARAFQEMRENRKEIREEEKEERKENKEEKKEEKKTLWTEMKKKQVEMITERIQTELDIRYKIVLKLKEKIGERITRKSATNDMASASAKLVQFSDAQYKADMLVLGTKLEEITTSDTPKSLLPGVREAANKVRVSLRLMHLYLVDVMKLVATAPKL